MAIERQCEKCGKTFTAYQSEINMGWGKFCSQSCSNSTKSKRRDIPQSTTKMNCLWCGKEYDAPTWRASKFCGRACYHAYRKGLRLNSMEQICQQCGKKFMLARSAVKRHRKYCSRACYAEAMRMQLPYPTVTRKGYIRLRIHGHPLASSRSDVFEHRLIYWQEHGYSEDILELLQSGAQVHHINGIRDDNRIENLELLITAKHPSGITEHDMIKTLKMIGYTITPHEDHGIVPHEDD